MSTINPDKLNALAERVEADFAEAVWREGWTAGYAAGRKDGSSDFDWCDIEADWAASDTAASLRSLASQEGGSK